MQVVPQFNGKFIIKFEDGRYHRTSKGTCINYKSEKAALEAIKKLEEETKNNLK